MIRTTSPRRRTLGGLAALVVVPVLMIGLSACSPTNGGDASNQPNTDTGAGGSGGSVTLAEWQLSYSECMRGEGIDMPDPSAEGEQMAMGADNQAEMAAIEAASEKCRAELGDPPARSAEDVAAADQEYLDWLRPIVACYRENGIEMPDPKAGESPQWPADVPEAVKEECGGGAGSASRTRG